MIRILAVGNSFSQDALAYLHDIAQSGGINVLAANLYVGGCSLETHHANMLSQEKAYIFEINGISTGEIVSLDQALSYDKWDYLTFQQASHDSGLQETLFPYLSDLISYTDVSSPGSEKLIHQTWAYEPDSDHDAFKRYGNDQFRMYYALMHAYSVAADKVGLRIIPSGEVIQTLRSLNEFDHYHGGSSLCRDGYHLDLIYGRYAVSAAWYEILLRKDVRMAPFVPGINGITADESLIAVIRETVHNVCKKYI